MKAGLIIALFVGIVALVVGLYLRRRNMTFEGTVTDKDVREEMVSNPNQSQVSGISISTNNGGMRHVYTIKVQTTSGKNLSWQVSEGKYQIINIGDTVNKRSGTTDIDITAKTQPTTQATPIPPTPPSPPTNTIVN